MKKVSSPTRRSLNSASPYACAGSAPLHFGAALLGRRLSQYLREALRTAATEIPETVARKLKRAA
jgi:hypothetical protein